MLAAPIVEDGRLVLVASSGGDDRQPAWYGNLNANPQVRVTIAGSTRTMIARTATDQEPGQLWPRSPHATRTTPAISSRPSDRSRSSSFNQPRHTCGARAATARGAEAPGTATRLVRPPTGQDTT